MSSEIPAVSIDPSCLGLTVDQPCKEGLAS
jgi:hypothetical protein